MSKMLNKFFTMNRKDRSLPFLFQAIIGAINLVLFLTLVSILIVYRNDLQNNLAFIVYFLYSFYVGIYFFFAAIAYYYLYNKLNKDEHNYFRASFLLALFGINFFTSLNFYLKSGLSMRQQKLAILFIQKKRISKIIDNALAQKQLSPEDAQKVQVLLKIVADQNEELDNVSAYILELLNEKKIPITLKIEHRDIIARGKYL